MKAGRCNQQLFPLFLLQLGEVVCRPCYQKKYSCSAFALSGADMLKLLDTTIIKSSEADKDACPRCEGKVRKRSLGTTKKSGYFDFLIIGFPCGKDRGEGQGLPQEVCILLQLLEAAVLERFVRGQGRQHLLQILLQPQVWSSWIPRYGIAFVYL